MTDRPPIFSPAGGNVVSSLVEWARQLGAYLESAAEAENRSQVVHLAHRNASLGDSAAGEDGILLFCPTADCVQFSRTNAWVTLATATLGLDELQALHPPADSTFIVGDGSGWVAESGSTARSSLGLGSIATQDASAVSVTDLTLGGVLNTTTGGELTIASGSVTPTASYHTVDTESDAASDDLDTITAGDAGDWLLLRTADAGRDVVLTESGNILIPGGTQVTLGEVSETALLFCDGTNWLLITTTGTVA